MSALSGGEYRLERYRPKFKSQVAQLLSALWGPDRQRNARLFTWRYEANPYIRVPHVWLAFCDGKLVGMRGAYGSNWRAGTAATTMTVPCVCDTVVDTAHRTRGLLRSLTRALLDDLHQAGFTYVFNLGASEVTYLASIAAGWRSLGRLTVLSRRVEPTDTEASPAPTARAFAALDAGAGATGPITVHRRAPAAAMAELVAGFAPNTRVAHVRDAEYFNWRYRSPMSGYRILCYGADPLLGYIVLRAPAQGSATGIHILDWEAVTHDIRAELLDYAIRLGEFPRLVTYWTVAPRRIMQTLLDQGFGRDVYSGPLAGSLPTILIRRLDADSSAPAWDLGGRNLLDPVAWDLRMSYADGT